MLTIDADAHVIECEKTWDYLEGSDKRYRPVPIAVDMPTGKKQNFWIIGGRLIERLVPQLADHTLAHWLDAASICDGLIKGLKHPHWPLDPWDGLKRLALMVTQHTAAPGPAQPLRLALQASF